MLCRECECERQRPGGSSRTGPQREPLLEAEGPVLVPLVQEATAISHAVPMRARNCRGNGPKRSAIAERSQAHAERVSSSLNGNARCPEPRGETLEAVASPPAVNGV